MYKENMEYTVSFTGHRPKSLPCGYNEEHIAYKMIKYRLRQLIAGIIRKKSATHFILGLAEGVDTWALTHGRRKSCLK